MKRLLSILLIMTLAILLIVPQVNADEESIKIELSDSQITVDGERISTDNANSVYLSTQMDNGGSSSEAKEANEKIGSIVNITKAGTYEFSGELTDGQISINANVISGEVKIILNNASITCKNAPAIFVYSKDIENENCKVIIETAEDSENIITGGKLKTSVEGWEDQDELDYYVDKGYSDEHEYYERYKYDGAISSDISLTFQGKGYLNVVSTKKEGIECKMNITIDSGIYTIESPDDGINACTDNKSAITINGGTVFVNVDPEGEEGDGIDSNGSLTINGGVVYAFACPGSDNGLDADQGVYINGGTVLSTGSMQEDFRSSNNKTIVQMSFGTELNSGDSIVIVDESGNEVFAFKLDRKITTFAYSSDNLENKNYSVYSGNVTGETDSYGIYTQIDNLNLDNLTKQENTGNGMMMGGPGGQFENEMRQNEQNNVQNQNNSYFFVVLGVLAGVLVLVIVVAVVSSKKKGKNK